MSVFKCLKHKRSFHTKRGLSIHNMMIHEGKRRWNSKSKRRARIVSDVLRSVRTKPEPDIRKVPVSANGFYRHITTEILNRRQEIERDLAQLDRLAKAMGQEMSTR